MIKKILILILLMLLIQGCGSFTKIKTTPFQGSPGYEVSGKIKRLNRNQGIFTVQVNVEEVWYEGHVNVYKDRGMMLGSFNVYTRRFAKVTRQTKKRSLFDFENEFKIKIFQKLGNKSVVSIPFKKTVLSDDLIKFKVDSSFFNSSLKEVYVDIALNKKSTANTLKKVGGSYGKTKGSVVRLNSSIELCLTCSANKGV